MTKLRSYSASLAAAAILLLAAWLRLYDLGSASFTYDSARLSNLAAEFVDTGRVPTRGMMSSVGVENPPLAVYLMAIPNLVSRDPAISLTFIALINILGVWALFAFGRRYWGAGVGLVASLLMAVGAWAVFYSRQLQSQDLLVSGIVLFFTLLYAWCSEKQQWALAGSLGVFTALTQIHFAALVLAPTLILAIGFWIIQRKHRNGRFGAPLIVGIGLSSLLYMPYLAWDATNDWQNARRAIELLGGARQFQPGILDFALMHIGGRNIHSLAGPAMYRQYLQGLPPFEYLPDRIIEALVIAAAAWLAARLWLERRQANAVTRDGLLLSWLLVPLLVFMRSSSDVLLHYLLPILPATYLALAIAARDLIVAMTKFGVLWRRVALGIGVATLLSFVAWQAILSLSINRFVGANDTPGGWGTPIRILARVAANMDHYARETQASRVLVLCPGSDARWDECPAIFHYLASRSHRVTFLDYNDLAVWRHASDDETLVLLAPGPSRAGDELLQFANLIPEASVPLRRRGDEYRFYRIHNPYQDIAQRLQEPALQASAIILVGSGQMAELRRFHGGAQPIYELPEPGQAAEAAIARLEPIASAHPSLVALSRVREEVDPADLISRWLQTNTFQVEDEWLGRVRFASYALPRGEIQQWRTWRLDADFGGQWELCRAALSATELQAGAPLFILATWRIWAASDKTYAASIQLWNNEARVIAQRDYQLALDAQPDLRPSGDCIENRVGLNIPAAAKPDEYRLVISVYDVRTGQRLPVGKSDRIELETVRVRRPGS
jgi:4-amino-4-deoxy-L-arabinose transferase-like glycosyltransferase